MNLHIQETWRNSTRKHGIGQSDVYETLFDDRGKLYRSCLQAYGRCIGKVRIDRKDGTTLTIGWIFVQRQKYDDCNETFLAETWVTVHEKPPTRTVQCHYA